LLLLSVWPRLMQNTRFHRAVVEHRTTIFQDAAGKQQSMRTATNSDFTETDDSVNENITTFTPAR
jgi:hypothetical protein